LSRLWSALCRLRRGLARALRLLFILLLVAVPAPLAPLFNLFLRPNRKNHPAQVVKRAQVSGADPPAER
jgi:hypothetical protein